MKPKVSRSSRMQRYSLPGFLDGQTKPNLMSRGLPCMSALGQGCGGIDIASVSGSAPSTSCSLWLFLRLCFLARQTLLPPWYFVFLRLREMRRLGVDMRHGEILSVII